MGDNVPGYLFQPVIPCYQVVFTRKLALKFNLLVWIEFSLIDETLRYTKGDKTLAAKLLGIATRTIYRRMKGEPEPPTTDTAGEPPSPEPRADDSH